MEVKDLYSKFHELITNQGWVVYSIILFIIALVVTYLAKFVYKKLHPKLLQGQHFVLDALLNAIYAPILAFIWIQTVFSIIKSFEKKFADSPFTDLLAKSREVAIALIIIWLFIRFIRLFEEQMLTGRITKTKPEKTTVHAVGRLLRICALLVGLLIILPLIGIPISGIVAFGGGSAIVLGIAAQQILSNYFGGVIIYSDRHFRVGDWIYSPDRNIEGNVEFIGWRSTRIRTFDKRPLYVPNAIFSSIVVVNAQRMHNRRIKQMVGIRYDDASKLEKIIQDIRAMLKKHEGIDTNQRCMVHFLEFGPSSLNMEIYCFTKTTEWQEYRDVQQDVFIQTIKIVEKHKAEIAFPTSTIHFADPKAFARI